MAGKETAPQAWLIGSVARDLNETAEKRKARVSKGVAFATGRRPRDWPCGWTIARRELAVRRPHRSPRSQAKQTDVRYCDRGSRGNPPASRATAPWRRVSGQSREPGHFREAGSASRPALPRKTPGRLFHHLRPCHVPFRFLSYATPSHRNCPDFALCCHTSAPTWLFNTCGAGLVMLRPIHARRPPCRQSLSSTTTAIFSHRCLSRSRPRDTGSTPIRTALLLLMASRLRRPISPFSTSRCREWTGWRPCAVCGRSLTCR